MPMPRSARRRWDESIHRVVARAIAMPWMGLRLMRLAPDRRSALRNLGGVISIWWARTRRHPTSEKHVFLAAEGKHFALRVGDYSELQVIDEIFANQAYAAGAAIRSPLVIFDLGSNIGASVTYFATRFPEARIYGFEPNPEVFARLEANVEAFPNVSVFPWAIAAHDGAAVLRASLHQSWSASIGDGEGGSHMTEVRVRSLNSILDELAVPAIDLLKIDIEGAEFEAIDGFPDPGRISSLVGEIHCPPDSEQARQLLARLQDFDLSLTPNKDGLAFGVWGIRAAR
jgi:FkbM family methyltransferase